MPPTVRPLDPSDAAGLELVATRMRATLVEVLGEQRGGGMYTMEWLRDRVRFHLDPARSTAAVLLAELDGDVIGHTIVRVETHADGGPIGWFSTTYVVPTHRRTGAASALLARGEAWMRDHGLRRATTWTADGNSPLVRLFEARGYTVVEASEEMVRLEKALP